MLQWDGVAQLWTRNDLFNNKVTLHFMPPTIDGPPPRPSSCGCVILAASFICSFISLPGWLFGRRVGETERDCVYDFLLAFSFPPPPPIHPPCVLSSRFQRDQLASPFCPGTALPPTNHPLLGKNWMDEKLCVLSDCYISLMVYHRVEMLLLARCRCVSCVLYAKNGKL